MCSAEWAPGHKEMAKLLLNEKMEGKAQDEHGWRALHLAVRNGHAEVMKAENLSITV